MSERSRRCAVARFPSTGQLLSSTLFGNRLGLWTKCKVRKPYRCWKCLNKHEKGSKAFRPITNSTHRPQRVCLPCVVHAVKLGRTLVE